MALIAVVGVVALHKLVPVFDPKGLNLERVVDVGAVVVIPELFGPRVFGGLAVVEEEDAVGTTAGPLF